MPRFKNLKTGELVEVTEEFAEQVLRPQGRYTEVFEEPPKVEAPKVSKKKAKKKTAKRAK